MKWEVKQLEDGRWGIFLCKKYWKFKDKPVMYAAGVCKESAQLRVDRLNAGDKWWADDGIKKKTRRKSS